MHGSTSMVSADSCRNSQWKGYSLVELLISIVVGSIVIAAAYGSYQVVLNMFTHSDQQAELHLSGREAMRVLVRDIRMAGFEDPNNTVLGSITTPLVNSVPVSPLSCGGNSYTNHALTIQYDDMNSGPDLRNTITYSVGCSGSGRPQLLRAVDGGAAAPLMNDIGNLTFGFNFTNGTTGPTVPASLTVQQVAINLSAIALGIQRGTSTAARLSIPYQAVIKTPNLYRW